MAKGNSNRIVIELEEGLKDRLYQVLDAEELTCKDWFTRQAKAFIDQHVQPDLFSYKVRSSTVENQRMVEGAARE